MREEARDVAPPSTELVKAHALSPRLATYRLSNRRTTLDSDSPSEWATRIAR